MGVSRNRIIRFGLMIFLMGVLGWGLAACGGDLPTATPQQPSATTAAVVASDTPGADGSTSASGEQEVDITLQDFSITPANVSVSAGKVRFVVTNKGPLSHNFTITDDAGVVASTSTFAPSDSPQTFEVDLKPGTYPTLCTVPGHAQHGQRGTITVK